MGEGVYALVTRVRSRSFTVRVEGEEIPVRVPKKLRYRHDDVVEPVVVGDGVLIVPAGDEYVVEEVRPRRNAFSRPASGRAGKRQVLAANLDLAVVVLSVLEPPWKPTTLDRYLVLASYGGVPALACLNKIDLDPSVREAPELATYPGLDVPVVFVSAETGEGVDELREVLAGRTAVFIGPSGAGKTSLLNRLVPGADRLVGDVSESTQKGRHTTTWVELMDLPTGGHIVDSPGLRVLDLTGLSPEDLVHHFPEIESRTGTCRFDDCRHLAEPHCAVKEAVEAGEIAVTRYESYRRIRASLEAGEG